MRQRISLSRWIMPFGNQARSDAMKSSKTRPPLVLLRPPFPFQFGRRHSWSASFFFLYLSFLWRWNGLLVPVQADFGDYADPTFQCPALTTCYRVCVANATDCPSTMQCDASQNLTLCADGSCAQVCDDNLISPCPYECASVACPKVIDTLPNCQSLYQPLYDFEATCDTDETTSTTTTLLTFTEPIFVFAYTWISVVIALIYGWGRFNQKIFPISGSTQPLQVEPEEDSLQESGDDADEAQPHNTLQGWQTGYRVHPLGLLIYGMTRLTSAGWIAVLIWLCVQFYVLDGYGNVSKRTVHIQDQVQLLQIFIVVWNAGLVWFLAWKWPHSMESVFNRRSLLASATHVAVYMVDPRRKPNILNHSSSRVVTLLTKVLHFAMGGVRLLMSSFFSDTDHHRSNSSEEAEGSEVIFQYCPVQQDINGSRYFVFIFRRYNYDPKSGLFLPGFYVVGETLGDICAAVSEHPLGLNDDDIQTRRSIIGQNSLEMARPTFLLVLTQEFNKPFYIYQMFMVITWYNYSYYHMAIIWTLAIFISAMLVTVVHHRNLINMHKITQVSGQCQVLRQGSFVMVDQSEVVPGDVVKLTPGLIYADMVLVSSSKLLMDESALTGESFPQGKVPVDPTDCSIPYDRKQHKRHTISAGTTVLEAEESIALVMQTSSYTAKGELIREIFFFRRHHFQFEVELKIIIGILLLYSALGFIIVARLLQEPQAVYSWVNGMYVVAVVLPALLPTVFTVSVGVSDQRLASRRIACINSGRILLAGEVKYAFFDKTGTLTKQGLDFLAANSTKTSSSMTVADSSLLSLAMATCHTLAPSQSGLLVGNAVDTAMFKAIGAKLISSTRKSATVSDKSGNQVDIVRYFDFDHHRMTQSVIVRLSDGSKVAFVKGSAESVRHRCNQNSLPSNFDTSLRLCAGAGIYQIMVASKIIDLDDVDLLTRDEVECDLEFIGMLNFKNKLRKEAQKVIRQLAEGDIKCIMVTGDNVFTAICIARECGILTMDTPVIIGSIGSSGDIVWANEAGAVVGPPPTDQLETGNLQLAVFGQVWKVLQETDSDKADRLMRHIKVFGRCTPHDKVAVVDAFVNKGYVTLMCGDGGNDCGALKAAHVGVALSDAEASMVSSFTSLDKSITSVIDVIREGRCALASSLATYKFIIMYGQIEALIEIVTAYFGVYFTEWCWVFLDGIWTISLALTLPLARAADRLSPTRPTASLLGPHTLASVLGVLLLNICFLVIALFTLWNEDWFQCRKWSATDVSTIASDGDNYEAEVMFLVTGYQYISSAMAFNFGYEFRQGWFRNYIFVALAFIYSFWIFYVALSPGTLSCLWRVNCTNEDVVRPLTTREVLPIQNAFNTTVMPWNFRLKVVSIMFFNAVAVCGYEYWVVNGLRQRWAAKKRRNEQLGKFHLDPEASAAGD